MAALAGCSWLRDDGDSVLLFIRLQPGARRSALCGEHGGRLKIAISAPPLDGRANDALTKWLAGQLGVARRQVSIAAGAHSREKTVRIDGIGAAGVRQRLAPE
jgi:uncharacterized protein (TIGR00251 family)